MLKRRPDLLSRDPLHSNAEADAVRGARVEIPLEDVLPSRQITSKISDELFESRLDELDRSFAETTANRPLHDHAEPSLPNVTDRPDALEFAPATPAPLLFQKPPTSAQQRISGPASTRALRAPSATAHTAQVEAPMVDAARQAPATLAAALRVSSSAVANPALVASFRALLAAKVTKAPKESAIAAPATATLGASDVAEISIRNPSGQRIQLEVQAHPERGHTKLAITIKK